MNGQTYNALQSSIQHWESNLQATRAGDVSVSSAACALCRLYNTPGHRAEERACLGCPVFDATGNRFCEGTPYEYAEDAYEDWDSSLNIHDRGAFREFAQKELNFLRALVPAGGPEDEA